MKRMVREKGYQGSSRIVGLLLALLMLVSVAMPVMEASAEEDLPEAEAAAAQEEAPAEEPALEEEEPAEEIALAEEEPAEEIALAEEEPAEEIALAEEEPAEEIALAEEETPAEEETAKSEIEGLTSEIDGVAAAATSADIDDQSLEQGDSTTIPRGNNLSQVSYTVKNASGEDVTDTAGIRVSNSGSALSLTAGYATEVGTYTVTVTWTEGSGWRKNQYTATFEVKVTASPDIVDEKVKVYVYVGTKAGTDSSGNTIYWYNNEEFLELLGISKDTVDGNGYFPVGEIYLDVSYFAGKEAAAATVGEALINSTEDWDTLLNALSALDTTTLTDKYAANQGNKVGDYLKQAAGDIDASMGSQKTALFRWNDTTSYGFEDQSVKYHLDLRFNTKTITFITGNNGITSGNAKDDITVDYRAYITGSPIQEPRNLEIPAGYKLEGYYEDRNFTIPWNGIGTPLNQDQVVYIKITEKDNVILYYKVAEGEGTLSSYSEGLNPDTGVAQGSTATAADNYMFAGWYADKECTQLLSTDATYVPQKGENEPWTSTTYYAKFVPTTADLTITKTFEGLDNVNKPAVTVTVKDDVEEVETVSLTDTDGDNVYSAVVSGLEIGKTYTVTESAEEVPDYDLTGTTSASSSRDTGDATVSVTIAAADNTVSFTNTYKEETISINYVPVTSDAAGKLAVNDTAGGTVDPTSETIGKANGTVQGSTADAAEYYTFVGWYADDKCATQLSTDTKYAPEDPTDGATYYALFEPAVTTVTISKYVGGNMGDRSKEFTFTANDKEFKLSHGGSKEITAQIGSTLTITEKDHGTYEVTVKVNDEAIDLDQGTTNQVTVTVTPNMEVEFTNKYNVEIDTGITTDSAPYILMLALAAVGGLAYVLTRRKHA